MRWLGGDCRFLGVVFDKVKRIAGYGTAQRLFTETQRLAMIARDGGCSFPGCTAPPAMCEAHHVIDYADGGPTCVSCGALLCGVHHREHQRMGWACTMIDGRPHWIPPAWYDPDQVPIRNLMHDPESDLP